MPIFAFFIIAGNNGLAGAPHATSEFQAGDVLTVYGQESSILMVTGQHATGIVEE